MVILIYIGYTDNLQQRIKQHKRVDDLNLIYYGAYQFEKLARQRERKLKHYGSAWRALKKKNYGLEGGVLTDSLSSSFNMFIGEYSYSIDEKKRLAIPAKFRQALGRKAVLTRGLDNCLVIYPLKEWQKLSQKLESLPAGQVDARGFIRIMLSGAVDVVLDKLGRVLIPDHLKKYAFLKKNIAIIGLSNRIEIWDERRWEEYKEKREKTVGEMAEQLGI